MELHGIENPHPIPIAQPQVAAMETQPDMELNKLLVEFDFLFQEPQGLPPARSHYHRINLKPRKHPVVVRPYRYPYA